MAGIIQEQHPDRCRLFMQWQRMEWPVMVDSYNLLEVSVVPLTLFIDENGIVRGRASGRVPAPEALREFLEAEYPAAGVTGSHEPPASIPARGELRTARLLEYFRERIEADAGDAQSHFRLGVAYRQLYDSPLGKATDFGRAVEHWSRALALDPNQYIWRRRLQQYGPRLEKPYPFYDWVEAARREIKARGKLPVQLSVEPEGAELAAPSRDFEAAPRAEIEPDPQGKILRDREGLVTVQAIAIPGKIEPGGVSRIHIELRPESDRDAHWNNEAEDLQVWISPPSGWQADQRSLSVPNPGAVLSTEPRRLELEMKAPQSTGRTQIPAYALFYVCEGVDGLCLYRRKDLSIEIEVTGPDSR